MITVIYIYLVVVTAVTVLGGLLYLGFLAIRYLCEKRNGE